MINPHKDSPPNFREEFEIELSNLQSQLETAFLRDTVLRPEDFPCPSINDVIKRLYEYHNDRFDSYRASF